MLNSSDHPLVRRLRELAPSLTPKAKLLARYVTENPRKAVFMRTRGLAEACGTSEATVVRFVTQLGYSGYGEFIQALRDLVDSELTLLDRVELSGLRGRGTDRIRRVVFEELDNLQSFYENLDMDSFARAVEHMEQVPDVLVVGSRLSYTFAYYLGWALTKVRSGVRILRGSDSTTIDWLTVAPANSLVVIIATTRYPNELIRIAKHARRLGHTLITIADSAVCPLIQFANISLVARCRHFPIIGSPSPISCLANCIISELIARNGESLRDHQEKLEQAYREHDLLFNLDGIDGSE